MAGYVAILGIVDYVSDKFFFKKCMFIQIYLTIAVHNRQVYLKVQYILSLPFYKKKI